MAQSSSGTTDVPAASLGNQGAIVLGRSSNEGGRSNGTTIVDAHDSDRASFISAKGKPATIESSDSEFEVDRMAAVNETDEPESAVESDPTEAGPKHGAASSSLVDRGHLAGGTALTRQVARLANEPEQAVEEDAAHLAQSDNSGNALMNERGVDDTPRDAFDHSTPKALEPSSERPRKETVSTVMSLP